MLQTLTYNISIYLYGAWEKEDANVGSKHGWWKVPVELSPNDTTVSVGLGDDTPVFCLVSVLALDWGADLFANIESSLFGGVDTIDLKEGLAWVQGPLVPAEGSEDGRNIKLWFLRHWLKRPRLSVMIVLHRKVMYNVCLETQDR